MDSKGKRMAELEMSKKGPFLALNGLFHALYVVVDPDAVKYAASCDDLPQS